MKKVYIGIDPGASGGIAIIDEGAVKTYPMPETYPDIYNLFKGIQAEIGTCQCAVILEDVGHGMPGQSSKATAVFARHCGHLEMALYALSFPIMKVTPQKWQKSYSNSLGKSKDYDKREWKNRLKALAQQTFPTEKVTLKNADALLMAEYARRMYL